MKLMKLVFALSILPILAYAEAPSIPTKEVAIGVNNVYIPEGLTANSDVFAVVNGIFPNGCYKWDHAETKNISTYVHEVRTFALVSQGMCIMVLIPFQKQIPLGKYASGQHTLHFVNGDGTYLEKIFDVQ